MLELSLSGHSVGAHSSWFLSFFCMTPSCFEYFLAFWYNKLFQAYLSPPQHQKQPFISPRSPSSKIWRQEVLLIPGLLSRHTHACVCTRAKRYPPLPSSLALAIPGYLSTWTPSSFCWPSHFPVETPSSSHQATPLTTIFSSLCTSSGILPWLIPLPECPFTSPRLWHPSFPYSALIHYSQLPLPRYAFFLTLRGLRHLVLGHGSQPAFNGISTELFRKDKNKSPIEVL